MQTRCGTIALHSFKRKLSNLLKTRILQLIIFLTVISLGVTARADVVKPALVEISVFTDERVEIEIRTSLEALLTGINARFRNTTESPNAEAYDRLRNLPPADLKSVFETFHSELLDGLWLRGDGADIALTITDVEVGPIGYTQVPRPSIIYLSGTVSRSVESLQWYYSAKFSDQAVRVRQVDLLNERWHWSPHQWIRDDVPMRPVSLAEVFTAPKWTDTAWTYGEAGFIHILPRGLDHILFILGIFLISMKLRPLLWQVTMFTVAHSLTLTLGVLGWVNLPPQWVEPLIALSIAYVAIENLFAHRLSRLRLPVVFLFGLLHGLGFAETLTAFGLPKESFIWALLWFNVGVEAGQVALLIMAFFTLTVWFQSERLYRLWVVIPGSLAVGGIGAYWFIERLSAAITG